MSADRQRFRREHAVCWLCGAPGTDVHEIARGCHRKRGVQERCCWVMTCRTCHDDKLGNYAIWPPERQLALKLIHDPEAYDRQRVNEIRGRVPDAISETDVAIQVAILWRMNR